MNRFIRRTAALIFAGFAVLAQFSLVAAHAGETHPHVEASPWPIAGPIIALMVSGAAFWLANRDGTQPSHAPTAPMPAPTGEDAGQPGAHTDFQPGLSAEHDPRTRVPLVALRSQERPSPRSAPHPKEDAWMTLDSMP